MMHLAGIMRLASGGPQGCLPTSSRPSGGESRYPYCDALSIARGCMGPCFRRDDPGGSASSRRRVRLDIVGVGKHMIGDLVAGRVPDQIIVLAHVADHLLECVCHIGPAAKLGMYQRVDAAGLAAQRLLDHEVETILERLKRHVAVAGAAVPGAPVVEEPVLGHDHHALAIDLDHIGQVVVALIAAPGVALLGKNPERLAGVVPARADPADRLLADDVLDDAADGADFGALLVRRKARHLDVIGGAVPSDLVAGSVQRLDGVRPFLHREAIDVDGRPHLVALENFENAPDAGIAAIIGVAERDQIDLQALRLLEVAAAGESLERDGERGADLLTVRPFGLWTHVHSSLDLCSGVVPAEAPRPILLRALESTGAMVPAFAGTIPACWFA